MDILDSFHPAVAAWFRRAFEAPTPAQAQAWPAIQAGRHVLIAAPTGSGKTFAAFLAAIDGLVREGLAGALADETHIVYVSPLKALSEPRAIWPLTTATCIWAMRSEAAWTGIYSWCSGWATW